ncbi:MAG: hypothetical protein COB81_05090 [Flavobacteriaceae bacterium]|nr:MAG: hypothetical protein COB81_05090 [Flavobacteriaceae bacterium]
MKTMKFYNLFLIITLITFFTACTKDDEINVDEEISESTDSNVKTEDQTDLNGQILLYKMNGEKLEKKIIYNVKGEDLAFQKATGKHQEIWNLVKKIIPPTERKNIAELLIFRGKYALVTGSVIELKPDLKEWKLCLAIDFAYIDGFNSGGTFQGTIIHEFAHVLSLNDTQIDTDINWQKCKTYNIMEGCTYENSYLNKFYSAYWKSIDKESREMKLDDFYEKYKDRFVSYYASSSPEEDFADTFMYFVLNDKPKGKTIAEKKILSFYKSKQLTSIRDYIRKNGIKQKIEIEGAKQSIIQKNSHKTTTPINTCSFHKTRH